MEKLKIRCNVTQTEFSVGYSSKKVPTMEKVEFSNYVAKELAIKLAKVIDTQKYAKKWKPLNPYYKAWKIANGLSPKIWECTGKLKASIIYDGLGDKLLIGVDETQRYQDGTTVLEVARRMEYGGRGTPERPLFRPMIQYVRSNLAYFYKKFAEEKSIKGGALSDEIQEHRWSSKLLQEYVRQHNLRR